MPKHILVTYDIVTPESVVDGDTAERGYVSEGYDQALPDDHTGEAFTKWREAEITPAFEVDVDGDQELSPAQQAAKWLRNEGYSEPSSSHFCDGVWYSWADSQPDYHTGESRSQSAHLHNFTSDEQREIHALVTKRNR